MKRCPKATERTVSVLVGVHGLSGGHAMPRNIRFFRSERRSAPHRSRKIGHVQHSRNGCPVLSACGIITYGLWLSLMWRALGCEAISSRHVASTCIPNVDHRIVQQQPLSWVFHCNDRFGPEKPSPEMAPIGRGVRSPGFGSQVSGADPMARIGRIGRRTEERSSSIRLLRPLSLSLGGKHG